MHSCTHTRWPKFNILHERTVFCEMALHCKHLTSSSASSIIAFEKIGIISINLKGIMNMTHQDLKLPTLCNFFIYSSAMLLFNRAQVSLISFLCLGVVPPFLPHKKASLGGWSGLSSWWLSSQCRHGKSYVVKWNNSLYHNSSASSSDGGRAE